MNRRAAAALIALLSFCAASPAQEPKGRGDRDAPMPWHLVDLWWDLGDDAPFESYAVEVTINDDVPEDSYLYVAPVGLGHLDKTAFYGGIQTRSDGHTKRDQNVRPLGPGFLFSMWGERKLDAIRPSLGGFCQSSGHEGYFVSARRPYKWRKGTYTYRVVKMDAEEVRGAPATWVGAFVHAYDNDENVFVGALRFPGKDLTLSRKVASFVEVYGPRVPAEKIPKVTVSFGTPVVNGKAARLASVEAVYPEKVPDYADAVARDGKVVVTVGSPVEGRTRRTVRLRSGD